MWVPAVATAQFCGEMRRRRQAGPGARLRPDYLRRPLSLRHRTSSARLRRASLPMLRRLPAASLLLAAALAVTLAVTVGACRPSADAPVRVTSRLAGTISAPDSLAGPYELIVGHEDASGVDTIGYAMTDASGRYSMIVEAPERGVYPLLVERDGRVLRVADLVVADGDSARLDIRMPLGGRYLRIRSRENDAWTAYRNARAARSSAIREALGAGTAAEDRFRMAALQTATVLWSLRETYKGTVASELASAESVALLVGQDDSLAVAHAREVAPSEAGYAETAEAARRAEARLRGLPAAVALLETMRDAATSADTKAQIQASVVTAYLDSARGEDAARAAERLRRDHADTPWARWAERAAYEARTLLPGKPAPAFATRTLGGADVSTESLRGRPFLLAFHGGDADLVSSLDGRVAAARDLLGPALPMIPVVVAPDSAGLHRLLRDVKAPASTVVARAEGVLAEAYNVRVPDTYFLVGADGKIVAKYVSAPVERVLLDARRLLGAAAPAMPSAAAPATAAPVGR